MGFLIFIKRLTSLCFQSLHHHYINWTKPGTATSLMVGTLTDLARSKSELVAENALLRQQLIILLCWLLSISVPKKSGNDGSTSFFFPIYAPDRRLKVSYMTIYFWILERIC
jgi:hypothetical protein